MRRGKKIAGLITGFGTVAASAYLYDNYSFVTSNNFIFADEKAYHKVKPGSKLNLDDIKANEKSGREKEDAIEENKKLQKTLGELQELMFAADKHSLLVIIQGQDTSGKDGLCRKVFSKVNPGGLRIESFKEPTEVELSHDYLWRIHKLAPARRMITVFNRSQYEDIVVPTLSGDIDKKTADSRYEQLANFEKLLTDSNTIVVKLYLHISGEEQEERLLARTARPLKSWKLNVNDWEKHHPEQRKKFSKVYGELLPRSSTKEAPWYIIPADHKWHRDLATASLLLEVLEPYRKEWTEAVEKIQKKKLPKVQKAQRDYEEAAGVEHKEPEDVEKAVKKKKQDKKILA